MARSSKNTKAGSDPLVYSGEVWTDARGLATVALPRSGGRLHGSLEYELRPSARGVVASVVAQLVDGRFTIETNEPHVKVAWRVVGRRPRPPATEKQSRHARRLRAGSLNNGRAASAQQGDDS